jgi:hypothetical protein
MLFPCHAVPRPCRTHTMPRPCSSVSNFSRPRHSAAWAWHGTCKLASAVQRWHVGNLPSFGFFRLLCGVHEGCYQKHTNPLHCRTSSSDISSYHADFHGRRGTVREWQWHGFIHSSNEISRLPQDSINFISVCSIYYGLIFLLVLPNQVELHP